jgi:hypothetical protein
MGLFAELILLILLFPFLLLFLGALVRFLAHDAIYNRPTRHVGRKPDSCKTLGSPHQGSRVEPLILPRVPKQNQDFQRKASPTEARSLHKKSPGSKPWRSTTKVPDRTPEFQHQGSRFKADCPHQWSRNAAFCKPRFCAPRIPDRTPVFAPQGAPETTLAYPYHVSRISHTNGPGSHIGFSITKVPSHTFFPHPRSRVKPGYSTPRVPKLAIDRVGTHNEHVTCFDHCPAASQTDFAMPSSRSSTSN